MGRGKKKKKAELKKKRLKKIKLGKIVPFTLSNCPKKLKGIKNRYEYKINVHHCQFNQADFFNIRYRSGHITQSNFKNANLDCIDFISVNLKKSKFKGTQFKNCVFMNCNLTDADFENAKFENTYFISCKLKNLKNFSVSKGVYILSHYPQEEISSSLIEKIILMSKNEKLEKFHILTTESKCVNFWLLHLLLSKYSENELTKFFHKLLYSNRKQFYTLNDYFLSLQNYYKK